MNLSSIITGVPEYIEFGWVTAPNAAGQTITNGTITTLTLTTEVVDTGDLVSAPVANVFTLPAGTYSYEASTKIRRGTANIAAAILALYNTTDAAYVSRSNVASHGGLRSDDSSCLLLSGMFKISDSKSFDLRILTAVDSSLTVTVDSGVSGLTHSNSTANADQRTTIKLWKLN